MRPERLLIQSLPERREREQCMRGKKRRFASGEDGKKEGERQREGEQSFFVQY